MCCFFPALHEPTEAQSSSSGQDVSCQSWGTLATRQVLLVNQASSLTLCTLQVSLSTRPSEILAQLLPLLPAVHFPTLRPAWAVTSCHQLSASWSVESLPLPCDNFPVSLTLAGTF